MNGACHGVRYAGHLRALADESGELVLKLGERTPNGERQLVELLVDGLPGVDQGFDDHVSGEFTFFGELAQLANGNPHGLRHTLREARSILGERSEFVAGKLS